MIPENVAARISPEPMSGCWLWTGHITHLGYGALKTASKTWKAHRLVYTLLKGAVPPGLELDHLCRTRSCVNPEHLEPVTHRENIMRGEGLAANCARKTHCKNGHPLSGSNCRVRPDGGRRCLTCKRTKELRRSKTHRRKLI